jgi:hypothetical protein
MKPNLGRGSIMSRSGASFHGAQANRRYIRRANRIIWANQSNLARQITGNASYQSEDNYSVEEKKKKKKHLKIKI